MFFKIGVVKNFAIFTVKHLSINRFSKGNSKTGDFLVNIAKFFRSFFLWNTSVGCFCIIRTMCSP